MLLFGIWLCVLTIALAIAEIRAAKEREYRRSLERELKALKIATEHITRDNERMARELMS